MGLLVATIERSAIRGRLEYLNTVSAAARFKGQFVRTRAAGREILYLGDSMLQYGVLPRVIERATGRTGYNLGLQAAPAPATYFMLRRALRAGARPSAIVATFVPKFLAARPCGPDHPYPWADLLNLREALELSWALRDWDLPAQVLLGQCLESYRNRQEIRAGLLGAMKGVATQNRRIVSMLWRNWNRNEGAQVNPPSSFREAVAPYAAPPGAGDWACHPVNRHYVREFLKLAARERVPVYWLIAPSSPATQAGWEHSGDDARHVAFVRAQLDRFPDLVVVDARHPGFESRFFVDPIHLNREGAIALSLGLAEFLPADPRPGLAGSRWVQVRPGREPKTDALVQDLASMSPSSVARSERAATRRR
jgi:hypothetical protein